MDIMSTLTSALQLESEVHMETSLSDLPPSFAVVFSTDPTQSMEFWFLLDETQLATSLQCVPNTLQQPMDNP